MAGGIVFPFIGTILSIPVFIHGLTQIMTLVTSFVSDTFSGEGRNVIIIMYSFCLEVLV